MHLETQLALRTGMEEVREMVAAARDNEPLQRELFALLFHADDKIAFRAAWVMTHILPPRNGWLVDRQDELIDEVMRCGHTGKRRVILNILYLQPLAGLSRMDFLDFCLERMASRTEQPGVQSLCIKIAYEICWSVPELLGEFLIVLNMMEDETSPAIHAARRNVLKAINRRLPR